MSCNSSSAERYRLNRFRVVARAIVRQPPRIYILPFPRLNTDDHVAIPRPRMLAIKLTRPRRSIRMRMIPSEQLKPRTPRRRIRIAHIFRRNRKPVARRIAPLIFQRQNFNHIAMAVLLGAQERAATLIRVRLHSMLAYALGHLLANRRHAPTELLTQSYA